MTKTPLSKILLSGTAESKKNSLEGKKLQKIMLRTREFLEIQTAWDLHGFKTDRVETFHFVTIIAMYFQDLSAFHCISYVKISFGYFSSNAKERIRPKLSRQKCWSLVSAVPWQPLRCRHLPRMCRSQLAFRYPHCISSRIPRRRLCHRIGWSQPPFLKQIRFFLFCSVYNGS